MAWYKKQEITNLINKAVSESINQKLDELNKAFTDKCNEVSVLKSRYSDLTKELNNLKSNLRSKTEADILLTCIKTIFEVLKEEPDKNKIDLLEQQTIAYAAQMRAISPIASQLPSLGLSSLFGGRY